MNTPAVPKNIKIIVINNGKVGLNQEPRTNNSKDFLAHLYDDVDGASDESSVTEAVLCRCFAFYPEREPVLKKLAFIVGNRGKTAIQFYQAEWTTAHKGWMGYDWVSIEDAITIVKNDGTHLFSAISLEILEALKLARNPAEVCLPTTA